MSQEIHVSQTIWMPAAAVYFALTNGAALQEWLCSQTQVSSREGGHLFLWWQQGYWAVGEFFTLSPDRKVEFSWLGKGEPAATTVTISLTEEDGQTTVSLTHRGIGSDERWQQAQRELAIGWKTGLENLKSVLETGLDRRVYERPFLGIFVAGQVTAPELSGLGIDAAGGVRISGTMAGTGAAAVGLEEDDIITDIGGSRTVDFITFQRAMAPYRVGDKIKITYYREGAKEQALLTLGTRPHPELPETAVELARRIEAEKERLDAQLDQLLVTVTPAEALYRPAEGEWNILEILAHLVTVERGSQIAMAAQISGETPVALPPNPQAWLAGVTAVYPSLPEMVALWKRTTAESVAMVAELPPRLLSRKAAFLNITQNFLLGLPAHTAGHLRQIADNLQAARAKG